MNFDFGFSATPLASEDALHSYLQAPAETSFHSWQVDAEQQVRESEEKRVKPAFERYYKRSEMFTDALAENLLQLLKGTLSEDTFMQQRQHVEELLQSEERQLRCIVDQEAAEQERTVTVSAQAVLSQFKAAECELELLGKKLETIRGQELHVATFSQEERAEMARRQSAQGELLLQTKRVDRHMEQDRLKAEYDQQQLIGEQKEKRREQSIRKLELRTDKERQEKKLERVRRAVKAEKGKTTALKKQVRSLEDFLAGQDEDFTYDEFIDEEDTLEE